MDISMLRSIAKPSLLSLGYGLFLATNAACLWGGVFPFLPVNFQTPQTIFWFFLAEALVFSVSYFASTLGAYFFPGPTRRFIVHLATGPYFLGWCCLIAAIYFPLYKYLLVILGGSLLGLGSAGFYMLWQRIFAGLDSDVGNHSLILGTAYGAGCYFLLYLIPRAVTAFLIPLIILPLFGLVIVLQSRTLNTNQAMFQDIPREHPTVYKHVIGIYWRSALSVGALGFCTGILRALVISHPTIGSLVNILSMEALLAASILLLILWQRKNLHLNITGVYRVFFPFVISLFLLLPFLPNEYSHWMSAILYALYSVAIMITMIQCAQVSRDRGINPVFIYGFFGVIIYSLHDFGFICGSVTSYAIAGVPPLAVVSLISIYSLGFMYFIGHGGFKKALSIKAINKAEEAATVELIALRPTLPNSRPINIKAKAIKLGTPQKSIEPISENSADTISHVFQDRISKQCELVHQHYRLSAREKEVLELLCRGKSVPRIAEELIVSENTIKTHTKRIYTKLDVHKKQDLVDLVNSFNPIDLNNK